MSATAATTSASAITVSVYKFAPLGVGCLVADRDAMTSPRSQQSRNVWPVIRPGDMGGSTGPE